MRNGTKRLVSVITCLALVLALMSMGVYAAGTTTLYCKAPDSWTNCNVYWWGCTESENPGWPGYAMTKGADGIWYYDVPSDAANVIFNNGSGTQSADLTMPTDENVQFNYVAGTWGPYGEIVEEPEVEMVTVYVEAPASWGTPNAYFWGSAVENSAEWPGNAMTYVDGNVYTATVPSDCTGLIFNGEGGQTDDLTVPTDDNTMYVVATQTWEPMQIREPVEVTYTYVVAGSETLCGTAWDTSNTANQMTVNGDVASITYTNVAEGDYEFKVVKVGSDTSTQWFGNGEDNVTFTVTTACDVTITFGLTDNAIAVAGNGIGEPEPEEPVETVYYLRGDMNGWDTSAPMELQADGTYAVTIAMEPGTYEYKAAIEDWTWSCPDANASVTLVAACDVTFVLDVENFTLTASGSGIGEPEEPEEVTVLHYVVAGSAALCGSEWDPADENNIMTVGEDGIARISYYNVAAGTYEFKVVAVNSDGTTTWYGSLIDGGNMVFTVEYFAEEVVIEFEIDGAGIGVAWSEETPEEPPVEIGYVDVYCEVPASWNGCNVYWWGSDAENPDWPGVAMDHYDGYVYAAQIPEDAEGVVFNDGNNQSPDLTLSADGPMYSVADDAWMDLVIREPEEVTYTYVVAGSANLCGSEWDYNDPANVMTVEDGVATITYYGLPAGTYEFKVVAVGSDGSAIWYGNIEDGGNVSVTIEGYCEYLEIEFVIEESLINMAWTDETVEPEEPTEPSEPEQPTEPSEPEEPTEPSEPEQPTEPSEPEQPTEPSEPEQPTEPSEPEEPTEPSEPEQPTEPSEPEEPSEPSEPEDPSDEPECPFPVHPIVKLWYKWWKEYVDYIWSKYPCCKPC